MNGTLCRTSYLSETGKNAIPTSQFSPIGLKILSYDPNPINANAVNNYTLAYNFPLLDTTMTFRIDQNSSSGTRYISPTTRATTTGIRRIQSDNPAGQGRNQDFFTHYLRFGNDYTISPSILDHLNIGFNRTNSKNIGAGVRLGNGQNWDQILGISGVSGPTFPNIDAGEGQTVGIGDNVDGDTIDYGYRINNNVDWASGKHNFKFGVDFRLQLYEPGSLANATGTFNFARANGGNCRFSVLYQSGNGLASLLLGQVDNANATAYASQARWRSHYYALSSRTLTRWRPPSR